jgi:fluoride exporter
MTWLGVAIAGALGSVARHGVNHLLHAYALRTRFPFGTMAVNLAGSLPIGPLGGFTTFSTFALDTFVLARTHSPGYAGVNVAVQVVGGLIAVWLGYRLGSATG